MANGLGALASPGAAGVGGNDMSPLPAGSPQTGLGLRQLASPRNGSDQGDPMMNAARQQHAGAKAVFDQLTKARGMLDHMRREMDQLVQKGDTVGPDEVIAAAGRVVGHGVGAREMAMMLADMPSMAGQGLAAWLAAHDQGIAQQEQHVSQMLQVAAHRYGVASIGLLAANHIDETVKGMIPKAGELSPRLAPRGAAGQTRGGGEAGMVGPNAMMPPGAGSYGLTGIGMQNPPATTSSATNGEEEGM